MVNKKARRKKIKQRIRKNIFGTAAKPRLAVFRSNKAIYCQLIDDKDGVTLAFASSTDSAVTEGNKTDQAKKVGQIIGEKAKSANISEAVFDRGGYLYHGRVKALADGAREAGLNI